MGRASKWRNCLHDVEQQNGARQYESNSLRLCIFETAQTKATVSSGVEYLILERVTKTVPSFFQFLIRIHH